MRVHRGKAILAGVAAITLGLTACSSSSGGGSSSSDSSGSATAGTIGTGAFTDCATSPLTCNSGQTKPGGTMTYVLEKTIPGWNQVFTDSNVFELAEVEDGILPNVYLNQPNLKPALNPDLMQSATSTVTNGVQTIVYKIAPDAVWSDGTPINADDFQYMAYASDGTHCPKCGAATSAGYSSIKSLTGSDNGKTVTVVLSTPYADWQSMFGPLLPAHLAKQHGDDGTPAGINASFQWFDKTVPAFSGGPMIIPSGGYQKDTSITEVPNPKWYGKTKSSLDKLIFTIITDQNQEPIALQNHDVDAEYPQPNANLVKQIKGIQNVQTYLGKGLTWEHFDINEKNQFLSDKTLREAIFTAINRQDIIARTVGLFVNGIQPLNNHIYVPGQPGYQDNVTATGQGSGDLAKAKTLLTGAGYTGVGTALKTKAGKPVTFACTYSAGNADRQTECEILQSTMKELGITVTLKTTTDLHELGTGQFDIIVFAWVGTPFVVSDAEQIYELKGGADYGYNNDPAAEKLINEAAQQTDPATIHKLMNEADVAITNDAYSLPLYQKPTFVAAYNNIVNLRDNATSFGPPVNVQEWGEKAS